MSKKNKRFVREYVLAVGFLAGFWLFIGTDPKGAVVDAIGRLMPGFASAWFWVIQLVLLALTLFAVFNAYRKGKLVGLLAVGAAFVGGVFIGSWGIWALLTGLAIGYFAPLR